MDISVKACAGVPSRGMGAILKSDSKNIVLSGLVDVRCYIAVEGVISVGPKAHFRAIDIYLRFAHGSVKQECLTFRGVCIETSSIPACSYMRQTSCTTCLDSCLLFKILKNSYFLNIIISVESTFDGPIVGNSDRFCERVIK